MTTVPMTRITMRNKTYTVPPRIGKMVANLLNHQEVIGQFVSGVIEFHFSADEARLKVVHVPLDEGMMLNGTFARST